MPARPRLVEWRHRASLPACGSADCHRIIRVRYHADCWLLELATNDFVYQVCYQLLTRKMAPTLRVPGVLRTASSTTLGEGEAGEIKS